MKLNAFLESILTADKFKNNDLAAVLGASALKEIELPDEVATQFPSVYLTKERAMNDPDLVKEYKGKAWANYADATEDEMKREIVSKLPEDYKTKYFAATKLTEKLRVLAEAMGHLSEKGSGDDVKTLAEKHRKEKSDWMQERAGLEGKITQIGTESAQRESGIKINYALRSKLMSYLPKLDPNLIKTDKQKNFIIDSTIHGLQSGYLLEFDKDNTEAINFLSKDRTDVYEGNKKVTLDDFILRELEPYTVKNTGGDAPNPNPQPIVQQKITGLTMEEMRRQKASQPV